MVNKRICVIGSGASGINAIKVCREENFDVVCYEKSDFVGGLWKYRDDDDPECASVTKSTIINSSKEMSAYTDFVPPREFANYMHNSSMCKYFELYTEHFDLRKFIKFNHSVRKLRPSVDYEETGKWMVTVFDKENNRQFDDTFDGVMVCTGHHVKPLLPTFKGQEKFNGRIIHTHSYKKPQGFEKDRVVVVGIGNSGGDAAVEMSMIAEKTYLSTRRGAWVLWRVGSSGKPFDMLFIRRWLNYLFNLFPLYIVSLFCEFFINLRFDHKLYGLKPAHRLFSQHPMVNDALPNRILSGTVVVKGDIQEFTENGVIFEGETTVTEVDTVILATGYEVNFPFIDERVVWTKDNEVELYKYMFPPHVTHPHTMALIGFIQAVGPAVPVSEMQSRWYVQLMKGASKLPSREIMMQDIRKKRNEIEKRYFKGARHTIQIDWVNFMDEIAEQFGVKPDLKRYFFTDPKLFFALIFGPCLPYHYRLNGPNSWKGAREAILTVEERTLAPFNTRKVKQSTKYEFIENWFVFILIAFIAIIVIKVFLF